MITVKDVMTRRVVTASPETTFKDAVGLLESNRVSGLPVVDRTGKLVGIVSEGDFIHRSEIGTQRRRGRFLRFIQGAGPAATDFVHEHGCKIAEIMTPDPVTITEDQSW